MSTDTRPTSPHLTIYKPQITSVLSILHRITGLALYAGTAVLVVWLWVLAYDPSSYGLLREGVSSPLGTIVMMGWTVAFYYHLSNGIRHLCWDAGMGFSISQVEKSGWISVLFTLCMTAITWDFILTGGK